MADDSRFLRKLFTWKSCSRPPERVRRLLQPNHTLDEEQPFAGNAVRTTKYTPLTFLPKNLFEQFHRFANLYFIFIVFLNWMPSVSAFGKEISMIPVLFVLAVTALKDAFEDRRRYLSDKRVNYSTCRVFCKRSGRYVKRLWKEVRVGDILHLSCNETIPADMLLLRSSDELGLCYIETINLDGESNLKQRQVAKGQLSTNGFHPLDFVSTIECDPPNNRIYGFHGSIIPPGGERVVVGKENLLLRDCVLKNTDFVEGIVIYAGHETKAMLNNGGPRHKRSQLEKCMNRDVVFCIVILLVLCFSGAIGTGLWLHSWDVRHFIPFLFSVDPMQEAPSPPSWEGFLVFWTYIIILQVMIPLSLYVTIELIKLGQVFHIHEDGDLYDPTSDRRVVCRALNIPEDLGQIQYVFSDKTGTLTENKMVFRRCSVAGVDYPHLPTCTEEDGFLPNAQLQARLSDEHEPENQRIRDFFLLLAICNTVVVSKTPHRDEMNSSGLYLDSSANTLSSASSSPCLPTDRYVRLSDASPGQGSRLGLSPSPAPSPKELRPFYEAESPDEIALVEAAFRYDFRLVLRTPDRVVLSLPGRGLMELRVLHVLPFDSLRKRMSVIVQHPCANLKLLFCKGADSSILPHLAPTRDQEMQRVISRTQNDLNAYSRKGLRILCMAKRVLSQEEYEMWALQHKEAELALDDKERHLHESACRIERQLQLLGATGIEDRLQEGVPQTVASLRAAGIVVWVLTGDKQETAVNIAYSCRLFSMDMEIITINARSKDATEQTVKFYLDQLEKDCSSGGTVSKSLRRSRRALVVDGHTLAFLLDKELERSFLRLAHACCSVLCCRTTPLQKASVVKLVKERTKVVTLAIGDGANDVSMIQTADVGVGIGGQEGMQAVMASDFAVARFQHLERLLLVHGHWCYDRLARIILYFFYKNSSFIFVVFWYQFYCGFSGMVMMDQLYLMLFNVLFTSLPPLAVGVYDQNLPDLLLLKHPHLYAQSRKAQIYTKYSFWVNIVDALYQSVVIYFLPHLTYQDTDIGIWEFGTVIYTICVVVQLCHISIETASWTILHVLGLVFSLGVYFGFAVLYNMLCVGSNALVNPYWVIQHLVNTPAFWLVILVTSVLACIPRFALRALQNTVAPSDVVRTLAEHKESRRAQAVVSVSWSRDSSSLVVRRIPTVSASVRLESVA